MCLRISCKAHHSALTATMTLSSLQLKHGDGSSMEAMLNFHTSEPAACLGIIHAGSPGFNGAFKRLGAAPCQGLESEGACPLILSNVVHNVLVNT